MYNKNTVFNINFNSNFTKMNDIKVCLRTAIDLAKHGVECFSNFTYFPKKNTIVLPGEMTTGGSYYPALTLGEALEFLYSLDYAVCIKHDRKTAWAEDEVHCVQFTVDKKEDYDLYNDADMVASVIIRMIRTKVAPVEFINTWLNQNTQKWLKAEIEKQSNETT